MSCSQKGTEERLLDIYQRLYDAYGPRHWWPAESKIEVILGAILTQAVAWTSVERALGNLKAADCLSPQALRDIPEEELAVYLRPSGYFNAKAKKVKAFIHHLWLHYGGDLERMLARDGDELRQELLSIHGIGEETADDILLYAGGKPSFVVDAYTRRVIGRLGLSPPSDSYQGYQQLFHEALPRDVALLNEYHALLDHHAKETCRKEPRCAGCCLLDICPTGCELAAS